ncbi:hypothetical protein PoB_006002300 [Plakobranchus ocellatus]|uniref:BZIP domain-containing protein n=1 Tax=Plakobranchus ocellatus TaxID=259542 RepID=A0AAV4CNP7_9GAST|nr:hypothetical protein PoB_006002300 [Plakobranchus ocellatus]
MEHRSDEGGRSHGHPSGNFPKFSDPSIALANHPFYNMSFRSQMPNVTTLRAHTESMDNYVEAENDPAEVDGRQGDRMPTTVADHMPRSSTPLQEVDPLKRPGANDSMGTSVYSYSDIQSCPGEMSVEQSEPETFEYLSSDYEDPMSNGAFYRADTSRFDDMETPENLGRSSAPPSSDQSFKNSKVLLRVAQSHKFYSFGENFAGTDDSISPWAVPSVPIEESPINESEEIKNVKGYHDQRTKEYNNQNIARLDQETAAVSSSYRLRIRHHSLPETLLSNTASMPDQVVVSHTRDVNPTILIPTQCDREDEKSMDFCVSRDPRALLNSYLQNISENDFEAYDSLPSPLREAVEEAEMMKNVQLKPRSLNSDENVSSNSVRAKAHPSEQPEQAMPRTHAKCSENNSVNRVVLTSGANRPYPFTISSQCFESPARFTEVDVSRGISLDLANNIQGQQPDSLNVSGSGGVLSQQEEKSPSRLSSANSRSKNQQFLSMNSNYHNLTFREKNLRRTHTPLHMPFQSQCNFAESNTLVTTKNTRGNSFLPGPSGTNFVPADEPKAKKTKTNEEGSFGTPARKETLTKMKTVLNARRPYQTISDSLENEQGTSQKYEMTAEEKEGRERRRKSNKVSAAKSRMKKKEKQEQLEQVGRCLLTPVSKSSSLSISFIASSSLSSPSSLSSSSSSSSPSSLSSSSSLL